MNEVRSSSTVVRRCALALCLSAMLGFASPVALSAEHNIDESIERARAALDRAASRLAELQQRSFKKSDDAKRAMLGVLIGYGPPSGGLKLDGVTSGGGAQAAGIQAGDVIISVGGQPLGKGDEAMDTLVKYMKAVSPGTVVVLEYERDGESFQADIKTKAHGELMHQFVPTELLEGLRDLEQVGKNAWFWQGEVDGTANIEVFDASGLAEAHEQLVGARHVKLPAFEIIQVKGDLAGYFEVDEGVVLLRVPASTTLREGDVLLGINGEAIDSPSHAIRIIAKASEIAQSKKAQNHDVAVDVLRRGKKQAVKIDPTHLIAFADVMAGDRASATMMHLHKEVEVPPRASKPKPPQKPKAPPSP